MTHNTAGSADLVLVQSLCETIDSARALSVYLLIKYSEFTQLINLEIKPDEYDSAESFAKDYLITNLLSKWKGFKIKLLSTKTVAIDKWKSVEETNRVTNARFRSQLLHTHADVDPVLSRARRKIADILGNLPSFKEVSDHCSWSKGATFDLRRGTDLTRKMTSRLTVTSDAAWYARAIIGHDPMWFESLTGQKLDGPCSFLLPDDSIVRGNKLTTVPKSSKTDRVICIEPTMNIYVQKGFGSIIRRRLKKWGVDLDDQTKNQYLASIAHKAGLATIDLSSASDTISRMLVLDLLPIEWACALSGLRCQETLVDNTWLRQEKFSSMGNGFTFELESLIFYALSSAVCDELGLCNWYTSVYGDDIIVPREACSLLEKILTFCGFSMNMTKSFTSGQFFESCGRHYFSGKDVTPAYLKEISVDPISVIISHNRLYRWSMRQNFQISRALRIYTKRFASFGLRNVPRIPEWSVDDRGFLTDTRFLGTPCPNHGFRCDVYQAVPQLRRSVEIALYAHKLAKTSPFEPDPLEFRQIEISSSDPKGHARLGLPRTTYRLTKAYLNR